MPDSAPIPVSGAVNLRDLVSDDLPILFEQQLDPAANYMAAFTAKAPQDRDAFTAHWAKVLADPSIVIRTIVYDGQVAGSIVVEMRNIRNNYAAVQALRGVDLVLHHNEVMGLMGDKLPANQP